MNPFSGWPYKRSFDEEIIILRIEFITLGLQNIALANVIEFWDYTADEINNILLLVNNLIDYKYS